MWAKNKIIENLMVIPTLATFYLIDKNVFSVRDSQGKSMQPTISQHSILVIDHIFYKWFGIQKNDVVVAVQPVDPDTLICKRVVEVGMNKYMGISIPKDHFWLEGDNKGASYDSRHHGPVPNYLIQGKVLFVIPI